MEIKNPTLAKKYAEYWEIPYPIDGHSQRHPFLFVTTWQMPKRDVIRIMDKASKRFWKTIYHIELTEADRKGRRDHLADTCDNIEYRRIVDEVFAEERQAYQDREARKASTVSEDWKYDKKLPVRTRTVNGVKEMQVYAEWPWILSPYWH